MATDVRVVTPITTWGFRDKSEFRALERPGLTISHVEIETGPASIECEYDEALAVPGTIAKIVEAERDGCDAVVIDCMGDPGLASGRECVSIPVLELEKDLDRTKAALAEEAVRAVEDDGADAIIFGCTGMLGCADAVRQGLLARGYDVPVIDPVPWAVTVAAGLVEVGLSHSKITYEQPPVKAVVGYEPLPGTPLARDAAE